MKQKRSHGNRKQLQAKYDRTLKFYKEKGWVDQLTEDQSNLKFEALDHKRFTEMLTKFTTKKNGKLCTQDNLRKHKNAISYKTEDCDKTLPEKFMPKVDSFLTAYGKLAAEARGKVELDEHTSEPLPRTLFLSASGASSATWSRSPSRRTC